jgi:hypothetical protein
MSNTHVVTTVMCIRDGVSGGRHMAARRMFADGVNPRTRTMKRKRQKMLTMGKWTIASPGNRTETSSRVMWHQSTHAA